MTDAYGNDAATSTGTIADTTNTAASGAPQRAESTKDGRGSRLSS